MYDFIMRNRLIGSSVIGILALCLGSISSVQASTTSTKAVTKITQGASCSKVGQTIKSGRFYICVNYAGSQKWVGTCTTINQKESLSGIKLQCVPYQVGNYLIWEPASVVSSAPNQMSENSQHSAANSPAASPKMPSTFADLYDRRTGIALGVWHSVQATQKGAVVQLPPVEVHVGPNSTPEIGSPIPALQYVANLFPSAIFPSKVVIIYYNLKDLAWGQSEVQSLMGSDQYQRSLQSHGGSLVKCTVPNDCMDGDSYITSSGTDYIAIGLPNDNSEGVGTPFTIGGTEMTEFYHSLQLAYYSKNQSVLTNVNNIFSPNWAPMWFNLGAENMNSYLPFYQGNESRFIQAFGQRDAYNQIFSNVSIDTFNQYLDISNVNKIWSDGSFNSGHLESTFGMGLMEIFMALDGPKVMLDIPNLMSQGKSFADAFQTEFRISWQDAEPTIAQVMYDKYLNNY